MADDETIVEEGDIFFLFAPTVDEHDPSGFSDVQRFYVAMRPRGGGKVRLAVIGRKRLPDVDDHERTWGFVDMVATDGKAVEAALREDRYGTKTRGEQVAPAARPAGEGVYAIFCEGNQMHLAYELELPEDPGPVQKALNIAPRASFALSVKNPEKGQPPRSGLDPEAKADYPKALMEVFRDRRFATEEPRLLDYERAEFVLIGARSDPEEAHDVSLPAEDETAGRADVFRKLRMAKSRHPVEPLLSGDWA